MGACSSVNDNSRKHGISQLPELYFLNRNSCASYRIEEGEVQCLNFSSDIKLYGDSAIAYLKDNRIIVAGGSDSHNQLYTSAFLFNPNSKEVSELPALPVESKEGLLLQHRNWVYFIGGLTGTNHDEPVPLMRYDLSYDRWELIMQDALEGKSIQFMLCGGAIYRERIYLMGGYIKKKGMVKCSTNLFSIDLAQERLAIEEIAIKLPQALLKPICIIENDLLLIISGIAHPSMEYSATSY